MTQGSTTKGIHSNQEIEDVEKVKSENEQNETGAKPRRRSSIFQGGSSVFLLEEEEIGDISYHPGKIRLYAPPKQRQKWGESQVIPRVNWGDTFFGLFFVAAAYSVGNILLNSPSAHGVLYFCGCFFTVNLMWQMKIFYDSRFAVEDDLLHRLREILSYALVGTVILHIRPVKYMSHPCEHPEMFAFALTTSLFHLLNILSSLEVMYFAEGERDVIRKSARTEIISNVVVLGVYLAATIVSGIDYFHQNHGRLLAGDDEYYKESCPQNDIPMWLCLGGFLIFNLISILRIQFFFPSDGSHKERTAPMNIGLAIHRNGEWIMLMLGESILSLLIVDVTQEGSYYVAFFCGILTTILLQQLHYNSQPHDPDHHAMRRNKDAGIWWNFTNYFYSASLVAVGVSFKLIMYSFTYERRLLQLEDNNILDERFLAGPSEKASSKTIANVFSVSMALTFFFLDAMILFHRGLKENYGRCVCKRTKRKNVKGITLIVIRVFLIAFFGTLGQYVTDPSKLAMFGLLGVVAQLSCRNLGLLFFPGSVKQDIHGAGSEELIEPDGQEQVQPNSTHIDIKSEEKCED